MPTANNLSTYDLLAIGRCSIDLYSDDVGAPFVEITHFGAYVGGSPTNVSVGVARLGLRTALLTAVGDDLVGDFVLRFLEREGVETRFIPRKAGRRTSAVLLGIEPPDRFPLVFYRDNAADLALDIDDVLAAPLTRTRALLLTGTALSQEPSRSASLHAAELARQAGATVFLDLDFRAHLWHDPRAFGVTVRQCLSLIDVALGTEEEIRAAAGAESIAIHHAQETSPDVTGDTDASIARLMAVGPSTGSGSGRAPNALVVKRGALGARVHTRDGSVIEAQPYPVDVLNVLGAGDAFAAGLIYGRLNGWDWHRSARMGNAAGAIVVTRAACANSMPTPDEVEAFMTEMDGMG